MALRNSTAPRESRPACIQDRSHAAVKGANCQTQQRQKDQAGRLKPGHPTGCSVWMSCYDWL